MAELMRTPMPTRSLSRRPAGLVALLLLAACASKAAPASKTPASAEAQGTSAAGALLFQPALSRVGEERAEQGTGFFVRGAQGQIVGITSAHFLGFEGPAITRVDALDVVDGRPLAAATHSLGWPGSGGITEPIVDLGDDLLSLSLSAPSAPVRALTLRASRAEVGEKVWLPNKDPSQPGGYTRVGGVVVGSTLACVTVRLDHAITLQSQSGSPVLFADDDALVGVLSRGGEAEGTTELLLTPAHYVEHALGDQAMFPLEAVAGAGGLGESTKLRYAWPQGESLHIDRRQVKQTGKAPSTPVSGRYFLDLSAHKKGLRVSVRDFQMADRDNLPAAERDKVERLGALVPAMLIDPSGTFVELENPEPVIKAMLELMGPLSEQQQKAMASMMTAELLSAIASADWNQQVTAWAGEEFEFGSVYVKESEGPFPLTGDIITTRMYMSATHRTACGPDDAKRSCVALWMSVQPDPEAMMKIMRAVVLKAVPEEKRAEAEATLAKLQMESTMRVTLITDPQTLVPVEHVREKLLVAPGQPGRYEHRQERMLARKPMAPTP